MTCFSSVLQISPFLTKLSQRLGKEKHELCIWDPYYCAGNFHTHAHIEERERSSLYPTYFLFFFRFLQFLTCLLCVC